MIEFAKEPISSELTAEIMPLAEAHFKEIDPFSDKPQTLQTEFYKDASPYVRVFTARDNGTLVGYAVFILVKHPHYQDSLQAQQDLLYLDAQFRKGLIGYQFMKWCDQQLEDEGAEIIYQFSSGRRDIGPILNRLGYKPIQQLYSKRFV